MTSLHLINKSCFSNNSLNNCLEICSNGDELMLLEDGVYCALKSNSLIPNNLITVYAIDIDLSARGISQESIHQHVTIVSYSDFVTLCCKHLNSVNWN